MLLFSLECSGRKLSETILLTFIHKRKVSVFHVASSEWERKWDSRVGRVPALKFVQHCLVTSGTVE